MADCVLFGCSALFSSGRRWPESAARRPLAVQQSKHAASLISLFPSLIRRQLGPWPAAAAVAAIILDQWATSAAVVVVVLAPLSACKLRASEGGNFYCLGHIY